MDLYTLKRHTEELKELLSCKPVIIRTSAGTGRTLNLHLLSKSGTSALILCLDNPYQGIRLSEKASDIDKNISIVKTFNRLLTNGRILSISMPCSDRIIKFHVGVIDDYLGKRSDYYIICEFTGLIADIFICNKEHKIIDRLSRTTNNEIGEKYNLPEQQQGFPKFIEKEAEKRGITCEELVSKPFNKAYIYLNQNKLKAISIFDLTHTFSKPDYICDSVNEAVNWAEKNLAAPGRIKQLKEHALISIKKDLKQKQKLLQEETKTKQKYENADKLQILGNLIISNIYKIKPGSKFIELTNWQTNETERIELDPTRTVSANAQKYFNQYKKAKRGIIEVEKRIEELTSSIKWLEEQIWLAENASEENDLIIESLYSEKKRNKKCNNSKKSEKNAKKIIKPDLETENAQYYIGRSAKQNDFLTFHLAKSNDYWFHANDVPGAHVIMKLKNQNEATEKDLHQGALLAAKQSFAKNSSKVSVDYTKIIYVKRIPKGGLGQVNYTNQKTIVVKLNSD